MQIWLDANRLSLNISKTNYIIFHSSNKTIPSDILIKIGEQHITRVNHVRFLGLLLDEHLSWEVHLNELSKKLARTCGVFFKIRHIFGSLKLLSLHDIFKLRLLTFIFESINKLTPSCFNNFFTLNISVHHYETRQSFRGDIYLNKKIRFNLASSPFDIWEQNSGMTYQLKSETLPLDFYSKII